MKTFTGIILICAILIIGAFSIPINEAPSMKGRPNAPILADGLPGGDSSGSMPEADRDGIDWWHILCVVMQDPKCFDL